MSRVRTASPAPLGEAPELRGLSSFLARFLAHGFPRAAPGRHVVGRLARTPRCPRPDRLSVASAGPPTDRAARARHLAHRLPVCGGRARRHGWLSVRLSRRAPDGPARGPGPTLGRVIRRAGLSGVGHASRRYAECDGRISASGKGLSRSDEICGSIAGRGAIAQWVGQASPRVIGSRINHRWGVPIVR